MAWQRTIPFGYMIQNGELLPHPQESAAVKMIFALYRKGISYNGIAAEMMAQGIQYYQKTNRWNKNMVNRILENERYLGADGYPRLVTDNEFLLVRLLRQTKTAYTPCPPEIQPVKEKAVCGICGAKMRRDTKNSYPRWQCQNPDCGLIVHISDKALLEAINKQLRQLAKAPYQLTVLSQEKTPSIDAIRIQNELALCFNRGGTSPEYMKTLIFAAAAERYNSTPDPTPTYQLECFRERLEQDPEGVEILKKLLQEYVNAILIGAGGEISLRLPNGRIFSPEEGDEKA